MAYIIGHEYHQGQTYYIIAVQNDNSPAEIQYWNYNPIIEKNSENSNDDQYSNKNKPFPFDTSIITDYWQQIYDSEKKTKIEKKQEQTIEKKAEIQNQPPLPKIQNQPPPPPSTKITQSNPNTAAYQSLYHQIPQVQMMQKPQQQQIPVPLPTVLPQIQQAKQNMQLNINQYRSPPTQIQNYNQQQMIMAQQAQRIIPQVSTIPNINQQISNIKTQPIPQIQPQIQLQQHNTALNPQYNAQKPFPQIQISSASIPNNTNTIINPQYNTQKPLPQILSINVPSSTAKTTQPINSTSQIPNTNNVSKVDPQKIKDQKEYEWLRKIQINCELFDIEQDEYFAQLRKSAQEPSIHINGYIKRIHLERDESVLLECHDYENPGEVVFVGDLMLRNHCKDFQKNVFSPEICNDV